MNRISVVVFPDTVPDARTILSLVPVFEPVVYCLPVENDDSAAPMDSVESALVESSLCSLHAPAPLGEDRERFLRLVGDLQTRRDDYASQLAHVSLAGMSTGSQPRSETKSSILSSLLSGHGIESREQEMRDKLLWQARLVLKLGEQFDADQRKIAEDMQHINKHEQALFSGLVREGEDRFSLTGRLTALTPDAERMHRLRLKAWARLLAYGREPVPGSVFVTTDQDAVDRLCEEVGKSSGTAPAPLVALPLPIAAGTEAAVDQVLKFRSDEAPLLEIITGMLADPSPFTGESLSQWNAALEKNFPSAGWGRSRLTLYHFPGARVKPLFLSCFGHDEDELEVELAQEPGQDIFIGLLAEQ